MSQAVLSRASQNNSSLDDNCEGEEDKNKALLHIFVLYLSFWTNFVNYWIIWSEFRGEMASFAWNCQTDEWPQSP